MGWCCYGPQPSRGRGPGPGGRGDSSCGRGRNGKVGSIWSLLSIKRLSLPLDLNPLT